MYDLQTGRKVKAHCADGRTRVATYTGESDSFFSIPARVQAGGKSVAGHVYIETAATMADEAATLAAAAADGTGLPGYGETDGTISARRMFSANAYGRNAAAIGGQK